MFVAHLVPSDAVYSSTEALTSRFQNKKPAAEVVAVSKLTAEQWQTMWQHRLDAMASGKKTSGRAGAGAEQDERLATLQWMQDVNHALRPVDWSFSQIRRSEPVSKTDEDMETRPHADAPILIVCTDCSLQPCRTCGTRKASSSSMCRTLPTGRTTTRPLRWQPPVS